MGETGPTAEPLGEASSVTPWEEASRRLAEGEYYWLATTRPDGHPHVRPLLAVWLGRALYFCAGPTTRKSENLLDSPQCSIATETDEFHFVIEGDASKTRAEDTLSDVADVYGTKYGWEVDIRDGAFHADGAPTAGLPPYEVYEVMPTTILGFSLDESSSSTRWRFG